MQSKFFVLNALLWFSMPIFAQEAKVSQAVQAAPAPKQTPAQTSAAKAPTTLKHIPVASFAQIPFIDSAQISPNGKMMAGLFGINGTQMIAALPIDNDASKGMKLKIPDTWQIGGVSWVNDENLLVSITSLMPIQADNWYISRLLAIHVPTGQMTKLFWDSNGQSAADVLWTPKDGSNEILFAAQNSIFSDDVDNFWPSVYKIDVRTGRKKKVSASKVSVTSWSADHTGTVRSAVGYDDTTLTSRLYYKAQTDSQLKIIDRSKYGENAGLRTPFMFVAGTDNGYIIQDNKQGFSGIYEVNLLTGAPVKTIFDPQNADVENVITSYDGTQLLGVTTSKSSGAVTWFTPEMKALQAKLDASVKGGRMTIESFNSDQTKMILRVSAADTAGDLYYYDHTRQTMDKISSINSKLGSKRLSPVKMIQYKARDGLGIEGVLTLPKGLNPKNLPFVVMPHGGPWGQDTLRYDYWAQFIASRGYAVLQPNFRGSTGYGTEFTDKGKGQMGFAMQDDVTDGVKWAVEQGIADPKRVCIVGASYGGYAAMWGIVKDPDLYRCAISINGVSLLRREVNDFGSSTRGNLYTKQWKEMTPDFNAVSPARFTDKIKAPLLLIHGKKDVTVDHVQSEKMNSAMKKAGKSVEFVSIPLADHYFTREEDRITLLTKMEAFLAKHNPAD
jgi:dipeptidyl aminopeptidase/acylaminoacyl peptidase